MPRTGHAALRFALAAALLLVATAPQAQESTQQPAQDTQARPGGQSLGQAANDPTASLMAFQIQNFYAPNLHNLDDADRNIVQFRGAVPFQALGLNHIARITVPYVTHSPFSDPGFGDITLFDLVAFDRSWGRFGVGAVMSMPTGGASRGTEKWAAGPAAGFVTRSEHLLAGLFLQNLFSFAGEDSRRDVALSNLQPITNYSLGDGWSVGTSEMNLIYDWDAGEFVSIPLGAKVSKLVHLGKLPLQVQLSYEHNFQDDGFGPADTVGLTFKLLLPK